MFDDEKPKKHRHQSSYTLLLVSDDKDSTTGTWKVGPLAAQVLAFGGFFVLLVIVCYIVYSVLTINGLERVRHLQSEQITSLSKEKADLAAENSSLNAMVDQLSRSISQKVVKENIAEKEEAEKHLPTGFPLTGAATMSNTRDLKDADTIEDAIAELNRRLADGESIDSIPGEPILYFTDAAEGSSIVATGAGTVQSIGDDKKYGHQIIIDHGNGYSSVYRNTGDAMVREGDEVTRGSILFVIGTNTTVGYQIIKDEKYIDPETMAQIDG